MILIKGKHNVHDILKMKLTLYPWSLGPRGLEVGHITVSLSRRFCFINGPVG